MTTTLKEARGILILIGLLFAAFVSIRVATRAGAAVTPPVPMEVKVAAPNLSKTPRSTAADRERSVRVDMAVVRDAEFKVTYHPSTATSCSSDGQIVEIVDTQCPGASPSSTTCPDGTYPTLCTSGTFAVVPTRCPSSIASTQCSTEVAPTNCGSTQSATACPGSLLPTNCPNGVSSPTNCPNGSIGPTMCINTILVATHCPERIKPTLCADGIWPTTCPPGNIFVPTVCPPAANPVICGPTQTLSVEHSPTCPTPMSDDR